MVIETREMSLKVPWTKIRDLRQETRKLLNVGNTTLNYTASFIGKTPIVVCSSTNLENHAQKTLGTQKQRPIDIKFMEIDCNSDKSVRSEPEILEEQTVVMERELILFRDTRVGDLFGLQRLSMENFSGPSLILQPMEPITCEEAHKFKRATNGALCAEAQERDGLINVSIFRYQNHPLLRQEIWRNNLHRSVGDIRKKLVALPKDQAHALRQLTLYLY
ncbi:hypothetical protein AYI69_g2442 [Smittium culicis]|uniref:Uncharacterized protein n=1 Tax=Smittium culicis TaxID=133412 RepID=A0A1R1YMJ6_9FUNG|nr:hypothetical protein AYI69_g2442 [Smittium culicis]